MLPKPRRYYKGGQVKGWKKLNVIPKLKLKLKPIYNNNIKIIILLKIKICQKILFITYIF